MKVLLVARVDLSLPGGVETHVHSLAASLRAKGDDVTVWDRAACAAAERGAGRLDAYDIVHHHAGPWLRGIPVPPGYVRTFHFSVASKMRTYLMRRRLRTLANPGNWAALREERGALRRRGSFIAVSPGLKRDLVRFHHVDPDRVHVISNGGCFDTPSEGRAAWRARHGLDEATPVLLTIGRRDYVKGLDLLERAWRRRPASLANAVWVAVGASDGSPVPGRIGTGSIPLSDVIEWIHAADLGAFPSYYEGGGIALLDMLAAGLYTLTHDVGIASEVVRSGRNGEILDPSAEAWREALARLLVHPAHPVRPGLGPEYRWDRVADRVTMVYRERSP